MLLNLPDLRLLGVDFTCAPSRKKPITVARGRLLGAVLKLDALDELFTLPAFEALLQEAGPWLGAFDFPFGLPREFVDAQALGDSTQSVITELQRRCPNRMAFRALVDAWGNTRPKGHRLVHRLTDAAMPGISSTSPLQTRYVPVGFMYFEGLARVVASGAHIPRMHVGDSERVALEGYPGLLAHELLGRRSYKNSAESDRLIARKDLVEALEQGRTRLGLRLKLSHAQRERLVDDTSGDLVDAALCLMQAAWCSQHPQGGLPADMDPVEGWIATVPMPRPGPEPVRGPEPASPGLPATHAP